MGTWDLTYKTAPRPPSRLTMPVVRWLDYRTRLQTSMLALPKSINAVALTGPDNTNLCSPYPSLMRFGSQRKYHMDHRSGAQRLDLGALELSSGILVPKTWPGSSNNGRKLFAATLSRVWTCLSGFVLSCSCGSGSNHQIK